MHKLISQEKNIIEAAKHVFLEKGFENGTMQEIASKANISRTTLNYYFRTKMNLFYKITDEMFDELIPHFESIRERPSENVVERINSIVEVYADFLERYRSMPLFVVMEINRNPGLLANFMQNSPKVRTYLLLLRQMFNEAASDNSGVAKVNEMPSEELITLFYGLLFMPYLISPLIKELYKNDKHRIDTFYDHHYENIKRMIVYFLIPEVST